MPIVSGNTGGGLGSVTLSGAAAASKVIGASSTNAASWVFPPGYEFGYDQITASVNIASTTEATGTTIITCAAHTFDGSPVVAEFFGWMRTSTVATSHSVCLFEGATELTQLAVTLLAAAAQDIFTIYARYRFTPTAASHTYTV